MSFDVRPIRELQALAFLILELSIYGAMAEPLRKLITYRLYKNKVLKMDRTFEKLYIQKYWIDLLVMINNQSNRHFYYVILQFITKII